MLIHGATAAAACPSYVGGGARLKFADERKHAMVARGSSISTFYCGWVLPGILEASCLFWTVFQSFKHLLVDIWRAIASPLCDGSRICCHRLSMGGGDLRCKYMQISLAHMDMGCSANHRRKTWNWSWLEKAQDTAQDAQTQTLRPYNITGAIPQLQVYMCS